MKQKVPIVFGTEIQLLRQFVYRLLTSVQLLHETGMVRRRKRRISVTDCVSCRAYVVGQKKLPAMCPLCGRPTSEIYREFFLAHANRGK